MDNKLPKTKIDERTGIEYHLEGGVLCTKYSSTKTRKNINMLYWVGTMNSIKAQAEEIVFSELIYI